MRILYKTDMYVNESKRNQINGDQNLGISIRTPPSPVRSNFSPPLGWVSRERNSRNFRHPCTVLTASWLRLPRRVVLRLTLLLSQRRRTHKLLPCAIVLEQFLTSPKPPCSFPLCCSSTEKGSTSGGTEHILVQHNTPPPASSSNKLLHWLNRTKYKAFGSGGEGGVKMHQNMFGSPRGRSFLRTNAAQRTTAGGFGRGEKLLEGMSQGRSLCVLLLWDRRCVNLNPTRLYDDGAIGGATFPLPTASTRLVFGPI